MEGEALGNRTGRCPTCAAAVEPDWLTCRSCGAILAAVRRTAQTGAAPVAATSAPSPPRPSDPVPSAGAPGPGPEPVVAGWPSPPPPPAEPPPPTTPSVHTAAIPAAAAPAAGPELGPNQWYSARAAATSPDDDLAAGLPATPAREPKAGIFADLPLAIPDSAGGRIGAFGLTLVAVAFFLPWSPMLPGISLFDAWGFNRGSRILVFLVDLVLLFLAIQPVGLSARVRTGWLPALFGIFVVGIFWEKLDAISVVGPGAWLFVIGGSLSLIGGLLTLLGREPQAAEPPAS